MADPSSSALLEKRDRHFAPNYSLAYRASPTGPLVITRGRHQYLYDDKGKCFLDCVNNVCHVGHSHPRVVKAAQDQLQQLNTNSRYMHPSRPKYLEELTATLPDALCVVFLTCTGSEANDLALRLARNYTGRTGVICVDGAYHGNNTSTIEVSPYKFNGRGGKGQVAHVRTVTSPDVYRGKYRSGSSNPGKLYAAEVHNIVQQMAKEDVPVSAFICESVLGCAGQIPLPDGYLQAAYQHVRAAGGLCIADEVQIGFGRSGSHFWAFEMQGVVPDIVTMGKPMGNGFPMGAVVTTREVAQKFHNGMEYFNTFGGNPVACAVGSAVLQVIKEDKLQQNALEVGSYLLQEFAGLKGKHDLIGDVRGVGLFIGVELVRDHATLEPAAEEADWIVLQMKERGFLLSTDGPLHNVLKLKPPMCFTRGNADDVVANIADLLPRARDAVKAKLQSKL